MKKYKLSLQFKNKPECERCILARVGYWNMDYREIRHCVATGDHPICPEDGCRKDCPLVGESDCDDNDDEMQDEYMRTGY